MKKSKKDLRNEDLLLTLLIASIIILIFYGVFTERLKIEDALTFLTGLLSGAGIGVSVERNCSG